MFGINIYLLVSRIIKGFHIFIGVANTIAIPFLLIQTPWYIGIPVVTMLFAPILNEEHSCILTRLENKYRVLAGYPELDNFLSDILRTK